MGYEIRPCKIDDASVVARLHVAAWQSAYRGILPDSMLDRIDLDERTERRRRMLEQPDSPEVRNWVIELDEIVGWASSGPARDANLPASTHELMAIYLDPAAIGRGYGRALLQHCVADLRGRGFLEMTMWVLLANDRARNFYKAGGFVRDPRVAEKAFADTGVLQVRLCADL